MKSNESLSNRAYRELKEKILKNEIKFGTYYLEKTLAESLGISRTPLKEALVRLENEGLIVIQPRHGIKVQAVSAEDMEEIYQIIGCLECEAVYLLANKGLSEEQIQAFDKTAVDMDNALSRDDLTAWAEADENFHRLLLEYCGNKRLQNIVMNHWDQAHRARYFTLTLREKPTNSTADHLAVIEAMKNRDVTRAVEIHRAHRLKGKKLIVDILKKFRMEGL
ncbi:GntR family transcriptional regulator [Saccharobesus litoralis]|uniref:GntR family transcriptional regulator n=1 Tax=Saccharobesus litoralis TaxID=2172099 RepID=A0A2S0VXI8_9ALTE|nr:GntR family transcriptional regulator [Saccharobesus litoralis]